MSAIVTCLIEDRVPKHRGLRYEHGLSFHVEVDGMNILFDCGSSGDAIRNAEHLDIGLDAVDLVVLSHGHYDHCGGFPAVAAHSGVKRLVTGPGFFQKKFTKTGLRHGFMGVNFDQGFLARHSVVHEVCEDVLQLSENCWLMAGVRHSAPEETIPERFKLRMDGRFVPDTFAEEVSVIVRMDDGIGVFVGCSHAGVVNILRSASERFGLPIRGVWGGTHLIEADWNRLRYTLESIKAMGISIVGFSHCTGEPTLEMIPADKDFTDARLCAGEGVELTASCSRT